MLYVCTCAAQSKKIRLFQNLVTSLEALLSHQKHLVMSCGPAISTTLKFTKQHIAVYNVYIYTFEIQFHTATSSQNLPAISLSLNSLSKSRLR